MKLVKDDFGILFNSDDIIVSNLEKDAIVTIGWKPIYYLDVQYQGDFLFEVFRR